MTEIYDICKKVMECIIYNDYEALRKERALERTSESDIKRILFEYDPYQMPIMPPNDYFEKSADIYTYNDGSGYAVDINFWYKTGESDLTLQLDIRHNKGKLWFSVDDVHVL